MSNFTEVDYGYPVAGQKYYAQHLKLLRRGHQYRIWNESSQNWVSQYMKDGKENAQKEFENMIYGAKEICEDEE